MRHFATRTIVSRNWGVLTQNNFAAFHSVKVLFGKKKKFVEKSDESGPNLQSTMPIKVLNVAEKNDAAKNIAHLLSNGAERRVSVFTLFVKLQRPQI